MTKTTNRHGTTVYYYRSKHGRWFRLPDVDDPRFSEFYEAAAREEPIPHVRDMSNSPSFLRKQKTEKALVQRIRTARTRAETKGMDFNLTLDWLLQKAVEQDFRCAMTNIEFFADHASEGTMNPYAPSLDRINPRKGYTTDNVRLVILAVNSMLMDWGERVFEQVFRSFDYQKRTKRRQSIVAPDSGESLNFASDCNKKAKFAD